MKIAIRLTFIFFLLSFAACSPKFPLPKSTGDLTYLKLKNGRAIHTIILEGDQLQFRLSHKGILYQIPIDSIEYIKVKGYNESEEQAFYLGFGIIVFAGIATVFSEPDASSFIILALGAISLGASTAVARKYRFKPAHPEKFAKLRLHFQYPQGLSLDQRLQILERHQQKDFRSIEDLGKKS